MSAAAFGPKVTQSGSALVVAVITVVIVVGLGAAFLSESLFRSKQAFTERELNEAQMICDAALEQARRFMYLYRDQGSWSWNDILQYNSGFDISAETWKNSCVQALATYKTNPGAVTVATTWPEAPVPAGSKTTPSGTPTFFGVPTIFHNGAFVIVVRNNPEDPDPLVDTDREIVVYVTGTMADGAQRQIEARLLYNPPLFIPKAAVMTGGTIKIAGNPTITPSPGTSAADIIANANLIINGNPTVQGAAYAVGTITINGEPNIQNGSFPGSPAATLPNINPPDLKPLANYFFHADGTIKNAAGAVIAVGSWYNWRFQNGEWMARGAAGSAPAGTYYFYTNVHLGGNSVTIATIITEKSAVMDSSSSGNSPQLVSAIGSTAIVAGGDVKITGGAQVTGFIFAKEQIHFSGHVRINGGGVIAKDEYDFSEVVSTTNQFNNMVTGTSDIVYTGGQSTILPVEAYSLQVVYQRKRK